MITLRLTGDKFIIEEIKRRNSKLRARASWIAEAPTEEMVAVIKRNVVKDLINDPNYSHEFTGKLLNNTRSESSTKRTSDGFETQVEFGYFVDYGLNLEGQLLDGTVLDGTHTPNLEKMLEWARSKGFPEARVPALIQKIAQQGPDTYPIIGPVWETNKDKYTEEVLDRAIRSWR